MKIIAHVKIRSTIAVQIAEHSRKAPVARWFGEGLAVFVKKRAFGPRHLGEFAATQIAIEQMRLTVFEHTAFRCVLKPIPILGPDHALTTDIEHSKAGRANGCCAIVGNIQVQVPVAIDVGQGSGHGSVLTAEPAVDQLGEHAVSVIQEETGAHTNSVDQQVQVAVAIHVRERGAGGKLSGTCHAGTGSNVGEPPSAKIPVEGVVAFQTAEIDITQSVAIHVTERDPGAVEADL